MVILVDLSRHRHFDSSAYQSYMAGELEDFEMPELKPEAALEHLPESAGARLSEGVGIWGQASQAPRRPASGS